MQDNDNNLYSERNFFTQVEQVVRKLNARADRIFLLEVAFYHLRELKNFRPVGFLKKKGNSELPNIQVAQLN